MNRRDKGSSLLYKAADLPAAELRLIGPGEIAIFSVRSPNKTTENEDAAAIISLDDRTAVLAVADGVGGLPAASQASAFLIDALEDACMKSLNGDLDLRDAILSGIEQANQKILEAGNGSATTLAAVEIQDKLIRTYHAGDSGILLTGQRGKVVMETVMHSPTGYAVEAGIISEDEALRHEDRHLISNVVGSRYMHVSMSMPLHMNRYDTLVLATDGLLDNIEKEAIIEIVRKGPLAKASLDLYELAIRRMTNREGRYKPDDLSCILYRRTA